MQVVEDGGRLRREKYYECTLCGITCGNIHNFREHVAGKKHQEAAAAATAAVDSENGAELDMDGMSGDWNTIP